MTAKNKFDNIIPMQRFGVNALYFTHEYKIFMYLLDIIFEEINHKWLLKYIYSFTDIKISLSQLSCESDTTQSVVLVKASLFIALYHNQQRNSVIPPIRSKSTDRMRACERKKNIYLIFDIEMRIKHCCLILVHQQVLASPRFFLTISI